MYAYNIFLSPYILYMCSIYFCWPFSGRHLCILYTLCLLPSTFLFLVESICPHLIPPSITSSLQATSLRLHSCLILLSSPSLPRLSLIAYSIYSILPHPLPCSTSLPLSCPSFTLPLHFLALTPPIHLVLHLQNVVHNSVNLLCTEA